MYQWTGSLLLVLVMKRATSFSKPMLTSYCHFYPQAQTSVKYEPKYEAFVQEIVFDNVICKVPAILLRHQCDKRLQCISVTRLLCPYLTLIAATVLIIPPLSAKALEWLRYIFLYENIISLIKCYSYLFQVLKYFWHQVMSWISADDTIIVKSVVSVEYF